MNWRIVRGAKDPISGEDLAPPGAPSAPRFHDLGFEHGYECEVRPSTAEEKDGAVILPPDVSTGRRSSCDCLVISVQPESGSAWKAAFFGSEPVAGFPDGIYALPVRGLLLVVARDISFLVPVERPSQASIVSGGTSALVAVPDLCIVAVSGPTSIVGIGARRVGLRDGSHHGGWEHTP